MPNFNFLRFTSTFITYKENVPPQSYIFHARKQYKKDMAFPGFMNIAALTLCIFVLANCNHQVQASSRAFSGKESKISPGNGLCASWVTIHGYKCQELEVRIPNIIKKINMHNLQWFLITYFFFFF